jgi:large subunit ribosomal protein L15
MAGMHKHKWSYTVKYAPDHFGHDKFRPPNSIVTRKWLNVGDLSSLTLGTANPIDLGAMGYDKLLGMGNVDKAYSIKVPRASASAVEKVKAAGGSVEVEPKPLKEKKEEKPQQKPSAQKAK